LHLKYTKSLKPTRKYRALPEKSKLQNLGMVVAETLFDAEVLWRFASYILSTPE